MSRGKRYSNESKLNLKKVFAVMIAFVVIIMFIILIKNVLSNGKGNGDRVETIDYYALYTDNAWGVVDSKGNQVINPTYQEMIVVINHSRDVFLCTYDVNEETGEYKTKVINKKNQEIFTGYDQIEALENYDKNGNVWYEENILRVKKDNKYGLINLDGKEILSVQYDNVSTLKGLENSLVVEKDGQKGLVNNKGVTIIEPKYKKIVKFGDEYKNGYITVDADKKYGVISYTGEKVLENQYEKIESIYSEKYFVITENGKQKVIDINGDTILSSGYDKIKQIAASGVVYVKDKKYGVIGYDGKNKIEAKYDDLKEINEDIYVAKENGKYGLINAKGKKKVSFDYTDIYYNSTAHIYVGENNDYNSSIIDADFNIKLVGILSELNTDKGYIKLKINDEYKYYNLKFEEKNATDIYTNNTLFLSKQNGKYGFIDKEGNVKVDYIYDDATEQNVYGYVAVKKDGVWGSIDKDGNTVIEPKYNLDSNLVINFIGKWHLGQDINMDYYCEK